MADTAAQNVFRVVGGKYIHNNEEVSKAEFDKRKADTDSAMRTVRGSSADSGQRSKPMTLQERKEKAFTEVDGMKKGGMAGGKWIQKAIKKPGALRKSLGVKAGKTIPAKKLSAAAQKPGTLGKRARLAETLKGFKK
jgi:hypothetical protein